MRRRDDVRPMPAGLSHDEALRWLFEHGATLDELNALIESVHDVEPDLRLGESAR